MSKILGWSLVLAACLSSHAVAQTNKIFRVATLLSTKVAPDYQCIVDGVMKGAKGKDFAVSITRFDYDNSLPSAVQMATAIAKEKYDLVIGPRTSQEALVTASILGAAGIPQILPVASHPDIPSKSKLTLRLVASGERYAKLTAKFVAKNLKPSPTKVLIVSNLSQPYSTFYREAFTRFMKADAPKVTLTYYDFIDGFLDYAAIVEQAKNTGIDVIYAPLYSVEFTELYAAVSAAKFDTNLVTHAGLFEARAIFVKHFRPGIKTYFNGIWDLQKRGPDVAGFDAVTRDACKDIPVSVRSATAYDAAVMALRVLKSEPTARGEVFVKAFKNLKYTGLLGQWKLDEAGDPLRSLNVFSVTKDGFDLVATIEK